MRRRGEVVLWCCVVCLVLLIRSSCDGRHEAGNSQQINLTDGLMLATSSPCEPDGHQRFPDRPPISPMEGSTSCRRVCLHIDCTSHPFFMRVPVRRSRFTPATTTRAVSHVCSPSLFGPISRAPASCDPLLAPRADRLASHHRTGYYVDRHVFGGGPRTRHEPYHRPTSPGRQGRASWISLVARPPG